MANKVINLEDFFMTTREKEGVWYEPKIDGEGTGIEVKLLGPSSDANAVAAEAYSKAKDEVEKIKDIKVQSGKQREIVCRRIASIITDIRGKDGAEINLGGKKLEYSDELVMQLLEENIDIRTDILNAAFENSTFMKKKN